MPPATAPSFFPTVVEMLTPPVGLTRPLLGYRCKGCRAETSLCDLNHDMLCELCGEPEEDPEDFIDLSDAAMLREHGTWGL